MQIRRSFECVIFILLFNYIFISYNQAIQLDTKYANAWSNKGGLLDELGR